MSKVLCLVTALAAGVAVSSPARTESGTDLKRIGVLRADAAYDAWFDAFKATLQKLGHVEGRDVAYEYRLAAPADLPQAAQDLLASGVDLLVAGGTPAAVAAKEVSASVPVVFVAADPVGSGVVASLAHPGGNVTGVATMTPELGVKRLELLRELLPKATRLAVLTNPDNPVSAIQQQALAPAAQNLGFRLQVLTVRRREDLDRALAALERRHFDAFIIILDAVFFGSEARIAQQTVRSKVPGIFALRAPVDAGGLISYGADAYTNFQQAAVIADKVLKGAKPADLPVVQPTRFELIVNLKMAKAIGLTVPESILLRATEVIR